MEPDEEGVAVINTCMNTRQWGADYSSEAKSTARDLLPTRAVLKSSRSCTYRKAARWLIRRLPSTTPRRLDGEMMRMETMALSS
eukprot:scaffold459948_cov29-Prasinocladus_malaysianus.AAC.1